MGMGEANRAKENYELALSIAEIMHDKEIHSLCIQNLGKLYSIEGDIEKAIRYYHKNYVMCQNEPHYLKIVPISSLMKEFYNKGDLINAKKYLDIGLEISNKMNPTDSIYVYEFKVYQHLINGTDHELEDVITKRVLPFLEKRQLYYEKYTYLKILADYYFNNRKYKRAATYYSNATNTFHKMFNE